MSEDKDKKILIAEDDPVTGRLLSSMLDSGNYTVSGIVATGEEILMAAEKLKPDIILMDIFLAGNIDGITASQEIRELYSIPVIYMTASTDAEVIERVKVTEPYGYLVKPVTRERLYSVLEIGFYKHYIEQQRKEEEEKYRSLFNNMSDSFAFFKLVMKEDRVEDFVFVEINSAFSENFSVKEHEIIGESGLQFFAPLGCFGKEHFSRYRAAALEGASSTFEEYSKPLRRWYQVSLYSPKEGHFALIAVDITERKKSEEALQESFARLRAILDSSSDSIALMDTEGKILAVNEAIARRFDRRPEDIVGRNYRDVLEPDLSLARQEKINEVIEYARPVRFEDFRNGRWNDNKISPIIDATGTVSGVSVFSRDVTEQKRLDSILIETNEALEGIFNAITDSIILLDREGRILNINEKGASRLGRNKESLLGIIFWDVFRDDVARNRRTHFEKVINTGQPEAFDDSRDGLFFEITIYPVFSLQGEVDRAAFYAKDITERISLEKRIIDVAENERLRIASDLHDGLGQNLTGLSFLIGSLKKKLVEESFEGLTMMDQILNLVKESVSQAQSLARGLYPVNLDRHGLVMALEEMAENTGGVFNIPCSVHRNQQITIENIQTATHLYYIAREAVNNAVKHSGAQRIDIYLSMEESFLTMSIVDDGRGLSESNLESGGIGLKTMQHRARLIRADLAIEEVSGGGTGISARLRVRN